MTIASRKTHPRASTINDVAVAAGVSISTVSRALSNPDRVNFRTRARVEQAAVTLQYVAHSRPAVLSGGKTGVIALLVPEIADPFFLDIIRGTQIQLKTAGYGQLLLDTEDSAEVEAESLEKLRKSTDGVILAASRLDNEVLRTFATKLPLVAINRDTEGVPCVLIDTQSGVVQALEHLVSLGHRRIGYVSGPVASWSSGSRFDALEHRGEELGVDVVKIGAFQAKITFGAAAVDMALNSQVTACICFGDLIAIGMLQRLSQRGISVPEEFSVIGCDDVFGASFCSPPLTTLTAPIEQAAREAVRMLFAQIGPSASPLRTMSVLPTHLTIRGSTGQNTNQQEREQST